MVASIAMEPISAGSLSDYRFRPAMGERPMLANAAPNTSNTEASGDRDFLPFIKADGPASNAEPERSRTADFAAAVIAGALAPTPQSVEEVIRRIGSTEIPEESQARLKDLLV